MADDVAYRILNRIDGLVNVGIAIMGLISAIFAVVVYLGWRAKKYLDMAELHGTITDSQQDRTTRTLNQTDVTLGQIRTTLVEEVPAQVATAAREAVAHVVEEASKIIPPGIIQALPKPER